MNTNMRSADKTVGTNIHSHNTEALSIGNALPIGAGRRWGFLTKEAKGVSKVQSMKD